MKSTLSNEQDTEAYSQVLQNHLYFEFSWEVANKIGGIFTVLRSKAPITVAEYGERYFLVGIYNPSNECSYELEASPLSNDKVQQAVDTLRAQGMVIFTGKWLVEGSPAVILLDVNCWLHRCNEFKIELWEKHSLPTPPNDWEINSCVSFGFISCHLIQTLSNLFPDTKIVAQFHEWLSGVGLLCLTSSKVPVATIFTTHATILGRHLCAGREDFYNKIQEIDIDEEAGKRGIYHKYCIERAAAHSCDIFTSVSHITAFEAENLLKRKVDGVLPNGLHIVKANAIHELQNLHQTNKQKIHSFVQSHFYGHLNFDMENVLYFFIAGRYEYRNKGFDIFIEALARLNVKLKHFNSSTVIVAFIIVPGQSKSYTVETLKGHALVRQLKSCVEEVEKKIGRRIFDAALRGKLLEPHDLTKEKEIIQIKRNINALKKDIPPSITTHNMNDDANDPVLRQLRDCNLCNWDSDNVKVVFHPEFISSNNPILPMEYEEFVRGCHLGVFPSYYEPWGYTPAECTVLGVSSITTNLSGFGCFIEESVSDCKDYGVFVVDRRGKSLEDSICQLADYMFSYCQKTRRQRIQLRNRTERLNELLDWKKMGIEYVKARRLALFKKFFPNQTISIDEQKVEIR